MHQFGVFSLYFSLLSIVPAVFATEWNDFTNNFATDLAPLITLFGEQVTKQFLSESLSIWDNIIFAMAPLGLLTAVVSLIRVCGGASFKAFIGRAQESAGQAEVELLSSVSESTAELFNEDGVARVFGQPRILEIAVTASQDDPQRIYIDKFINFRVHDSWNIDEESEEYLENMINNTHKPNLSLNIGIIPRPLLYTYFAAVTGVTLQSGVLVFAALTVYKYPENFEVSDGLVANAYAFPAAFSGTIMVCLGMFLCAYLIETSTKETHFRRKPEANSRLYWVQPGAQKIGDQVFDSHVAVSDLSAYVKSTRADKKRNPFSFGAALLSTIIGFILQFVGLRALHASVILAQIGATITMAIIRAMLRTRRMTTKSNSIYYPKKLQFAVEGADSAEWSILPWKDYPECIHGHELDLLAMGLFGSVMVLIGEHAGSRLEMTVTGSAIEEEIRGVIGARKKLALIALWDDLDTAKTASSLQRAIQDLLEILSPKGNPGDLEKYYWPLLIKTSAHYQSYRQQSRNLQTIVQHEDGQNEAYGEKCKVISIALHKSANGTWYISEIDLEALIGLWTFSFRLKYIYMSPVFFTNLSRRIIASVEFRDPVETLMWYKVWIQRRKEPRWGKVRYDGSVWLAEGWRHNPRFGCSGLDTRKELKVLEVKTRNSTEKLCAQDLFIYFLEALLRTIDDIGGETSIREPVDGVHSFLLQNTTVEAIADKFESSGLGTREDAYECIFPALYRNGKMPSIEKILPAAIEHAIKIQNQGKWEEAIELLEWTSKNAKEKEMVTSALGDLYHAAIRETDIKTVEVGFNGICKLLEDDPNSDVCQQYGWIGLRVIQDETPWLDNFKNFLIASGAKEIDLDKNFDPASGFGSLKDEGLLKYLLGKEGHLSEKLKDSNGRSPIHWAASWNNIRIMEQLLKAGVDPDVKDHNGRTPASIAAEMGNGYILEILAQKSTIGFKLSDSDNRFPLSYAAIVGDLTCVQILLKHYPELMNSRDRPGDTALIHATINNKLPIVITLLDQGADTISQNEHGRTTLHYAGEIPCMEILEVLLQRGLPTNTQDKIGYTALHLAVVRGHKNAVTSLLHGGANVNILNKDNYSALDSAIYYDRNGSHLEIVKILLEYYADISYISNNWDPEHIKESPRRSAIIVVALTGDIAIFALLIRQIKQFAREPSRALALELLATNKAGSTCFHQAAMYGNHGILDLIIKEEFSEYNMQDKRGDTALHLAIKTESRKCLDLLLRLPGLDLSIANHAGETPLYLAIKHSSENLPLDEMILEKGSSDINIVNLIGDTPLRLAIRLQRFSTARKLLESGASITGNKPRALKDKGHESELHIAAKLQKGADMVELLLDHGAEADERDGDSKTAIYYASMYGFEDIKAILLKHGATTEGNLWNGETRIEEGNTGDEAYEILIEAGYQAARRTMLELMADIKDRK